MAKLSKDYMFGLPEVSDRIKTFSSELYRRLRQRTLERLAPVLNPVRVYFKPVRTLFAYLRGFIPLSIRGLLLLGLSLYALVYYGLEESDLSATIISSFFLALIALAVIRGAFAARSLRRKLQVSLAFDSQGLFSRREIDSGIVLESLAIAALYRLNVYRVFAHAGVQAAKHQVRGVTPFGDSMRVLDTCRFRHRGAWELESVAVELQDFLGLTLFRWQMPKKELVEIQAPEVLVRPLPIVAASSQAGDILQHTENRSGDLFDIKPYDPSDGTKRILWKTYAKSRQLVVRRPEPAMVPEGEVAIYNLAQRDEDHVAAALAAYVKQLEENNIVVLLGCDTLPSQSSAELDSPFVDGAAVNAVLVHDVWNPELGTAAGFPGFIESLHAHNKFPMQILFFIDRNRLNVRSESSAVAQIKAHSEQYAMQAVFVAVDPGFLHIQQPGAHKRRASVTPLHSSGIAGFGPTATSILEAQRAES